MSSILNGVRWTEKRLTDEQLLLLEDAEKKNLGCLKCEGMNEIKVNHFNVSINKDTMSVDFNLDTQNVRVDYYTNIQITYCPFCGKKL